MYKKNIKGKEFICFLVYYKDTKRLAKNLTKKQKKKIEKNKNENICLDLSQRC